MKLNETFKTSIDSLFLNKVRSFLTMLGVIIGVFSVVTLISLVKGVQNYIEDQFKMLGANTIFIMPGKIGNMSNGSYGGSVVSGKLDEKHVKLIETNVGEYLDAVTPATRASKLIAYKTKDFYASLFGFNYQGPDIFNMKTIYGRFFTKAEQLNKSKVVILGYSVNNELFNGQNSVGQKVKIEGQTFEVIGVTEKKSPEYDEGATLPYTSILEYFPGTKIVSLSAKAKDNQDLEDIMEKIKIALLKDLKKEDFSVLTQKDFLESINSILGIITIALGAIAGISLFVGGIGIMNIELVSVTERTREIGLRKALGATAKNIRLQFMTEAVLISVTGGFAGLLLGWLTTFALKSFVRAEIPMWAALLSLGFSALVGVVFGTYPAIKASQKDPIEALRYE